MWDTDTVILSVVYYLGKKIKQLEDAHDGIIRLKTVAEVFFSPFSFPCSVGYLV